MKPVQALPLNILTDRYKAVNFFCGSFMIFLSCVVMPLCPSVY